MTTLRECADTAAAALVEMLRSAKGTVDTAAVADVIERVLNQATSETEEGAQRRIVDLQASMQERLTRLLDASPAVIYSFKAKDDFAPIFVSDSIGSLFGYAPRDYLDDANFWREHVHPEDLPRIEAEIGDLFVNGKQALEYRFRRKDGSYCWVSDEQHLIRDEKGARDRRLVERHWRAEEGRGGRGRSAGPSCPAARKIKKWSALTGARLRQDGGLNAPSIAQALQDELSWRTSPTS